jgi:hypothetical protein
MAGSLHLLGIAMPPSTPRANAALRAPSDRPADVPTSDATSEVRPVSPRVTPTEEADPELAWLDEQLAADIDLADEPPDTDRNPGVDERSRY